MIPCKSRNKTKKKAKNYAWKDEHFGLQKEKGAEKRPLAEKRTNNTKARIESEK